MRKLFLGQNSIQVRHMPDCKEEGKKIEILYVRSGEIVISVKGKQRG